MHKVDFFTVYKEADEEEENKLIALCSTSTKNYNSRYLNTKNCMLQKTRLVSFFISDWKKCPTFHLYYTSVYTSIMDNKVIAIFKGLDILEVLHQTLLKKS